MTDNLYVFCANNRLIILYDLHDEWAHHIGRIWEKIVDGNLPHSTLGHPCAHSY